jgi:hypothetical protein
MPDSQQPPFWGPAYHERDLDALLSGEAGNTPLALRPVESTLAALRAAPAPRELSSEATARAAFRVMARPQVPWTAPAEHGTVTQNTLVLPPAEHLLSRASRRPPRAARHRRRRAIWDGHRPAIALTSIGVVAVVVIAVAVTGAIPDSIGQMTSFGSHPTSGASSAAGTGRARGSLDGTGHASHPTPSPVVTSAPSVSPSATTSPGTICREFFEPSAQDWAERSALFGELVRLAGGPDKVDAYCFLYLNSWAKGQRTYPAPPAGAYGYPGGPADRGSGNPGAGQPGIANLGGGYSGGVDPGAGDPVPSANAAVSAGAGAGQGQRALVPFGGQSRLRLHGSPGLGLFGERVDDDRADFLEGRSLGVAQPVEDQSAHRRSVLWRGLANSLGPAGSERDEGTAAVDRAFPPCHQAPALHPGELMGQPALLPVERVADLERP